MKPLDGIRVVDLSRVLAGPYCAQLLADMGASVIKIEIPGGDENRGWPPTFRDISSNFASVNRGKRSLTLNLKSPEAPKVLRRLTEWADVMLHNFLPETAERLGITYPQLKAINPRLVFCSLSGYGDRGPMRHRPGYDTLVQAFSGVMAATGERGGGPVRCGVSFIDMSTGLSAYAGIVSALLMRGRTGEGTWVRGSLLETSIALMGFHAVGYMHTGVLPGKNGSGSWNIVPYQAFECSDGLLVLGAPNEGAWKKLCTAIDEPGWITDERFRTNKDRVQHRDVIVPMIQAKLAGQTREHWTAVFEVVGLAVAPIQTIDQVMTHPQVLANDMVVYAQEPDGTRIPYVGMPFKLEGSEGTATTAAPKQNQDFDAVLKDDLGFSAEDIQALCRAQAVYDPAAPGAAAA